MICQDSDQRHADDQSEYKDCPDRCSADALVPIPDNTSVYSQANDAEHGNTQDDVVCFAHLHAT